MRYTVVTNRIEVIGGIWWPYGATAAYQYAPSTDDLRDDDGNVTRESVQGWLNTHAGDFSSITDFYANVAVGEDDVELPWADDESEMIWTVCMFGEDDV